MSWLARKPLETTSTGEALPRSLGFWHLTAFGVGNTVGAGIFVLTGTVAASAAGPGVVFSFLLAAATCLLAGLCYAELAALLPATGSAYSYAYVTLGEGPAWMIGWLLVLEYLFAGSLVAIGWSGYLASALANVGLALPPALLNAPLDVAPDGALIASGALVNLPAVLLTLACTVLLILGTRLSAAINNWIVAAKIAALLLVVAAGAFYIDRAHWDPFVPPNNGQWGEFGWSGVVRGAGLVFFAYVGFDAVSTMTREAHRPQRTVPLSLLASLAICTALYVLVSLVITGLVDYRALGVPDPILLALEQGAPALIWVRHLVTLVALVGLTSVVLVSLYGQVRIFYAMAEDGLLPASFCRVHPHLRTPHVSTLVTGLIGAAAAGLLPLRLLGEAISVGVLLAFIAVCASVLILRRRAPDLPRPFRVPCAPFVPLTGMLACAYLILGLPSDTWLRVASWSALGALIYVLYGRHRSGLQMSCMQECKP